MLSAVFSLPFQGSLTVEDCVVHIDLNLAKVLHEKWKESVMVGRLLSLVSPFHFNKIYHVPSDFAFEGK